MKKESRKKYICFGGMLFVCVALAACGNETGSEAGEPETDFTGAAGEAADNGAASSDAEKLLTEEGQIAEQTFPVTVAGLGDVVFAAYEPDYDQNMQADVTFLLLSKKGEVLQTLSGVRENNIRAVAESYAGVDVVSFPDYNDDGRTDIITITNYSYITGPEIGEGFAEVRVYSGSEHGYFRYEEDISEMIRAEIKTPTIQNVRDFLGDTN